MAKKKRVESNKLLKKEGGLSSPFSDSLKQAFMAVEGCRTLLLKKILCSKRTSPWFLLSAGDVPSQPSASSHPGPRLASAVCGLRELPPGRGRGDGQPPPAPVAQLFHTGGSEAPTQVSHPPLEAVCTESLLVATGAAPLSPTAFHSPKLRRREPVHTVGPLRFSDD